MSNVIKSIKLGATATNVIDIDNLVIASDEDSASVELTKNDGSSLKNYLPEAGLTQCGVVSTGHQRFRGKKEFMGETGTWYTLTNSSYYPSQPPTGSNVSQVVSINNSVSYSTGFTATMYTYSSFEDLGYLCLVINSQFYTGTVVKSSIPLAMSIQSPNVNGAPFDDLAVNSETMISRDEDGFHMYYLSQMYLNPTYNSGTYPNNFDVGGAIRNVAYSRYSTSTAIGSYMHSNNYAPIWIRHAGNIKNITTTHGYSYLTTNNMYIWGKESNGGYTFVKLTEYDFQRGYRSTTPAHGSRYVRAGGYTGTVNYTGYTYISNTTYGYTHIDHGDGYDNRLYLSSVMYSGDTGEASSYLDSFYMSNIKKWYPVANNINGGWTSYSIISSGNPLTINNSGKKLSLKSSQFDLQAASDITFNVSSRYLYLKPSDYYGGTTGTYRVIKPDSYWILGASSTSTTSNRFYKLHAYQTYVDYSYSRYGFYENSDESLKSIIKPLETNLDELSKLRKVYFNWKETNDGSTGPQIGIIAQDVKKLYPEIVSGEEGNLTVAYDKLGVIALDAIDKLNEKNKSLEARIERLEKLLS